MMKMSRHIWGYINKYQYVYRLKRSEQRNLFGTHQNRHKIKTKNLSTVGEKGLCGFSMSPLFPNVTVGMCADLREL